MNQIRAVLLALMTVLCAACTTTVFHTFAFDMRGDDQDADVLDYRYGTESRSVRPSQDLYKLNQPFGFQSVTGDLPRPDFLYVKWRNRVSGKIYEDTVDLRNRMPEKFNGQRLYFMIKGAQLYVYLISQELRQVGSPAIGPREAWYFKTLMLYPGAPNGEYQSGQH